MVRPVIAGIGLILHVPALMALVSVPVCLIFREFHAIPAFLATTLLSGLLGQVLVSVRSPDMEIQQYHAMLIAALSWFAVALLGALPFLWIARLSPLHEAAEVFRPLENALFESLSGFTATGLTMVTHASELPHSLQWWRSFSEWVGGVGVVVLMLVVLPSGRDALHLYYSEARGQRILPSIRSTTKAIWSVYISYTLGGIVLLWLVGEPPWRAVNHAMTAIATGGFAITDQSVADVSPSAQLVYLLIMISGAVSFLLHYRLLRHRGRRASALRDTELHLFMLMLSVGAVVLWMEGRGTDAHWLQPIFHWVSALTTTGFQVAPLYPTSIASALLLTLAMTVGAMAGSTGGGIKQARIVFMLKGISWRLKGILGRPHEVLRYRLNGSPLSRKQAQTGVEAASFLLAIWLVLMFLGVFILLHVLPADTRLEAIVLEVASAQSNTGLSTGLTNSELPLLGKLVLMLAMWTGRLEIVPVLVVIVQVCSRR